MLVPKPRVPFAVLLSLLSICTLALGGGPNFEACLSNVINSGSLEGTVDINGVPTTNISLITGLTYDRCVTACGRGAVAFDWQTFSQQFTSWLLPWLALISQLPYGSGDALSNCLVVFLTVGSPTLAAYSLSLAIISNRWMVKRFERTTYTNSRLAAQSLSSLQQVSLDVPKEEHVLPSLIVLPANRKWWKKLARELDYPVPKWTLASTMSVIYLALADIFAWVSNLANPLSNGQVYATGQGISSLWLCFLPIVIGNLLLSPKSDWDRIRQAFKLANSSFQAARGDGLLKRGLPKRGLPKRDLSKRDLPKQGNESQLIKVRTAPRDAIEEDEICSASVFFYARAFTWLRLVEKVADSFDAASQRASVCSANEILPRTRLQVIAYCKSEDQSVTGHATYEIYSIFARSAFLAIFLQWGTTGAAIMAQYFTPTKGLGCRSGAYLLYGSISTLIWLLCVVSNILAHSYRASKKHTISREIVWGFSIVFGHAAKVLAALNAVWLFLNAIIQFSNIEDNCWCNSSKLSLGNKAYTVIVFPNGFSESIKYAWAGGLVVSFVTAVIFLLSIILLRKPVISRTSR